MVFENKGSLRYHALWAYTGISALALVLDKIPLPDVQALGVVLGPLGGVILADIVKHRNVSS
jgi:hypothetical protein